MNPHKPIDCEQALARIFEYIDHELHAHERAAMQAHLHTCKSCFSRAEFERRLKQKVATLRAGAMPEAQARLEKLIKSL
ncbi:MAG TPA: zf-HC2 domain-containing protein [Burkholderiales bacterium]